jgi:hypothetical protein
MSDHEQVRVPYIPHQHWAKGPTPSDLEARLRQAAWCAVLSSPQQRLRT